MRARLEPLRARGERFDAGTFDYFCTIHGSEVMHGTVAVPIRKRSVRRNGRRLVRLWWRDGLPPPGQVFDVQFRPGDPARGMLELRSRIRDADEAIRGGVVHPGYRGEWWGGSR